MNKPLSTKERIETGIFKFLNVFQECEKQAKYIRQIR